MVSELSWSGVYPAATTQFAEDLSVDLAATQQVQDALINDGVDGLIEPHVTGEPRVAPGDEGGRGVMDTHADNHKASECRRFVPETRCGPGGPAACG